MYQAAAWVWEAGQEGCMAQDMRETAKVAVAWPVEEELVAASVD